VQPRLGGVVGEQQRVFSMVGALSIIRFRNAVKETRDVGFIFFTMAIGMAVGTKFYLLAVAGAVVISLMIVVMMRLDWFSRDIQQGWRMIRGVGSALGPYERRLS